MLTISRAGLQTLIVDAGRPGYAHLGVPRSGSLDPVSLALANQLVGNSADAAGLECLLRGPVLTAAGRRIAAVAPGGHRLGDGELDLTRMPTLRMWVAVEGGIESPVTLGSRSADLLGGIGPGALTNGQTLDLGRPVPVGTVPTEALTTEASTNEASTNELPSTTQALAVLPGPDSAEVAAGPWVVQPNSDRTALRLDGSAKPHAVQATTRGLVPGAIQLPPDGRPIIFLAGHPTTGGYPIVGFVRSGDLPRLAQLRPGHTVEFGWPRPQRVKRRLR